MVAGSNWVDSRFGLYVRHGRIQESGVGGAAVGTVG
jgi:hypothetical protein